MFEKQAHDDGEFIFSVDLRVLCWRAAVFNLNIQFNVALHTTFY